jgi:formamidopyrimidine-DNA glycosylase
MPELPEVETLRRSLERTLVGRSFVGVRVLRPRMFVSPAGWSPAELVGRRIVALRRRAKFLIIELDGEGALVVHLRLAGQLVHRDADGRTRAEGGHPVPAFGAPLPHKSTHMVFDLDDGSVLYLTDIRQFGRVWFLPTAEVPELLAAARLGPEPLADEFTLDELRARLARRPKGQLKPLLLDQSFVGGVGNIYADEIMFDSRLTPATKAADLRPAQIRRLHDSIRSVLRFAVEDGVAEILNGKANPDRDFPRVHGREGRPCPRCGTTIVKSRFAGRGTYTCPKCQRGA